MFFCVFKVLQTSSTMFAFSMKYFSASPPEIASILLTPAATAPSDKTVNIPLIADGIDEENETFTFTLTSASNAAVSDSAGSATMTIEDAAGDIPPTISINDITVSETAGTANFTASLSGSISEKTITANYATSDDTAEAGLDYTATSGTISFAPGIRSQNISVSIISTSIFLNSSHTL